MDTPYELAQQRRAKVSQEIAKLESKIAELRKELSDLTTYLSVHDRLSNSLSEESKRESKNPQEKEIRRNPQKEDIGEIVKSLLNSAGRPLNRNELFDLLEEKGIHLFGSNPKMILSTMLWRMQDQFIRLRPYGYWIRNLPCPQANYDPQDANSEHAIADFVDSNRPPDDEDPL